MGVDPVTLALIATAASAGSTLYSGVQQKKASDAQAQATLNEAAYEADAARAQAEKIRRAGREQVGAQKAALAAAGVKLADGTALELQRDTTTKVEEDALTALLTGRRITQRGSEEASLLRRSGNSALTSSVLSAAGQAATAGYKYKTGKY